MIDPGTKKRGPQGRFERAFRVRLSAVAMWLAWATLGEAVAGAKQPTKFDFEYFEGLKSDQAAAALDYLNKEFPAGSTANAAVNAVTGAGGKCAFVQFTENGQPVWSYWCKYVRPGHGLMFFVSSIEWQVAILTAADGEKIRSIRVGRGATGS